MGVVEIREKTAQRQRNTRSSDRVLEIGLYVFAVLMLIVLIYPLYFIIIASFSEPGGGCEWTGMALAQGFYAGRLSRIAEAL